MPSLDGCWIEFVQGYTLANRKVCMGSVEITMSVVVRRTASLGNQ